MFVSASDGVAPATYKVTETGKAEAVLKLPGFRGWEIAVDSLAIFMGLTTSITPSAL